SPPDIAYLYGSWAPNVAQIPQVVNLTKVVQRPGVNWSDFWLGEREAATVNGKVIGIPALVDNLAVVYNKTLFAQAGLAPPGPGSSSWPTPPSAPTRRRSSSGPRTCPRAPRTPSGTGRCCCGRPAARSSSRATSRPPSTPPPGCRR